ncbi:putative immunity protein [Nocardia sp. NPDC057668]|uniref:putative immunity protein n=1 Tax=Nocardia sp. NPDC057668 TaxID=3346202 RepID=UPI00366DC702
MADSTTFELTLPELREVTAFAAACASPALPLFEQFFPDDDRPRAALAAAAEFADGGKRGRALRDTSWAAHKAAQEARDAGHQSAGDAARAAAHAAGSAYLHPLPNPTQVKHILGAAAHTARALELAAGPADSPALDYLDSAARLASPTVISVLRRYPPSPPSGGRIGELLRHLDTALR